MSARHRQRLAGAAGREQLLIQQAILAEKEEEDEEEEGEEDDDEAEAEEGEEEEEEEPRKTVFAFAEDDSEEDEESEEESVEEEEAGGGREKGGAFIPGHPLQQSRKAQRSKPAAVAAAAAGKKPDEDALLLDEIISEQQQQQQQQQCTQQQQQGGAGDIRYGDTSSWNATGIFNMSAKRLSIDWALKQRFGSSVLSGGGGVGGDGDGAAAEAAGAGPAGGGEGDGGRRTRRRPDGSNRSKRAAAALRDKRCLFGASKPTWPAPPSFVSGGLGMRKCEAPEYYRASTARHARWMREAHGPHVQWFTFDWSDDYGELQREFVEVQNTFDTNALVLFCAQHPCHVEALMQIGMLMAHTADIDRAHDLIRRCLNVHEAAYVEAFKPHLVGLGGHDLHPACRMDAATEENAIFFAGLFRHAQFCSMIGCHDVAANISRLLLSLDPITDPLCTLLCLDYYLLACNNSTLLLQFRDSNLPIGYSAQTLQEQGVEADADGHETKQDDGGGADAAEHATPDAPTPRMTIADLPNWRFNSVLAHLRLECVDDARDRFAEAAFMYPSFVSGVLGMVVSAQDVSEHHLAEAHASLRHPLFATWTSRRGRDGPGGVIAATLSHLDAIFTQRCRSQWGAVAQVHKDAMIEVLTAGLRQATERFDSLGAVEFELAERERLTRCFAADAPGSKLRNAAPADFKDTFDRLPLEANMLDPNLVHPMALRVNGRAARAARAAVNGAGGGGQPGALFGGLGEGLAAALGGQLPENMNMDQVIQDLMARLQGDAPQQGPAGVAAPVGGGAGGGAAAPPTLGTGQPLTADLPLLRLFLQSLLPWTHFENEHEGDFDDDEEFDMG